MSEFEAQLQELDASLQREALMEVVLAGAEILRDAERALAPRDRGDLADGIQISMSSSKRRQTHALREATVEVGPGADQFYARFVERGTKERFYKKGRRGSSGVMPAHPFVGPAFDSSVERITQAMQEKAQDIIDRAVT